MKPCEDPFTPSASASHREAEQEPLCTLPQRTPRFTFTPKYVQCRQTRARKHDFIHPANTCWVSLRVCFDQREIFSIEMIEVPKWKNLNPKHVSG